MKEYGEGHEQQRSVGAMRLYGEAFYIISEHQANFVCCDDSCDIRREEFPHRVQSACLRGATQTSYT